MFRLKYLMVRKGIRNLTWIQSGIQENLFFKENANMKILLDIYTFFD